MNELTNACSLLQASDEINVIYEIQEYSKHSDLLADLCMRTRAREQPAISGREIFLIQDESESEFFWKESKSLTVDRNGWIGGAGLLWKKGPFFSLFYSFEKWSLLFIKKNSLYKSLRDFA